MKKVVVSAFSLFILGAVSANAQTTTGGQSGTQTQTTTPATTPGTATQTTAPSATEATGAGTATGAATATSPAATGAATSTGAATTADAAAAAPAGTTVSLEELPAAVKKTLTSEKLKTWTPSAAQLVKDAAGKEYYEIEVKQGEQVGTVKIGKDGKPVK